MTDKASPIANGTHTLTLGKTFKPKSQVKFHSMRYDFKPASVDTNQDSLLEVGDGNQVTVTVPHVQSSGISHTVYKGNKKPTQKECVLIIDHDTGQITLEQLSNAIHLKKTRLQSSQQPSGGASRSSTPSDSVSSGQTQKGKTKKGSVSSSPPRSVANSTPLSNEFVDTSSSSDSDSDVAPPVVIRQQAPPKQQAPPPNRQTPPIKPTTNVPMNSTKPAINMLSEDLRLSESDSECD